MEIERYQLDDYPIVIKILVNNEPINFDNINSIDFKVSIFGNTHTLNSTTFDTDNGIVTFDVTSMPVLVAEVGEFKTSLVANNSDGTKMTLDIGMLKIKPII